MKNRKWTEKYKFDIALIVGVLFSLQLLPGTIIADDQYVAVNPATLETISGKTLMIASYVIVLGLLSIYWIHMHVKEKRLETQVIELQQELKKQEN